MINRLLIRIKTLQILYNYYRVKNMSVDGAISTLKRALDASYQLYFFLCGLPLEISDIAEQRLEKEQEKFIKDLELIDLYSHLSQNKLVEIIRRDTNFVEEYDQLSHQMMTRGLVDYIQSLTNDATNYIRDKKSEVDWDDLTSIRSAWRSFFGEFTQDSLFTELLEETNTYLNDDIPIVYSFVPKVINAISDEKNYSDVLKPAYANEDDSSFGTTLLEKSITNGAEYREIISRYFKNWDKERVSEMDYLILQLAVTEAIHFPTIATRVTINEYLNLAHHYSTPNSYTFINGILHELFTDLKKEGKILGE